MPPSETGAWWYRILFVIIDAVLLNLAIILSLWLRLDGQVAPIWTQFFSLASMLVTPLLVILAIAFGLYNRLWALPRWQDAAAIVFAVTFACTIGAAIIIYLQPALSSRTVLAMTLLIALLLIIASRLVWLRLRSIRREVAEGEGPIPALIYGAGHAGASLARHMATATDAPYRIIGFVDDDFSLTGMIIAGQQVWGRGQDLPDLVARLGVRQIIIAVLSASPARSERMIHHAETSQIPTCVLWRFLEISAAAPAGSSAEGAPEADPHLEATALKLTADCIAGRRVVIVAGCEQAAADLAHHICGHEPEKVMLIGSKEGRVNPLALRLRAQYPDIEIVSCVCQFSVGDHLQTTLAEFKPELVFHTTTRTHSCLLDSQMTVATGNHTTRVCVLALTLPGIGDEAVVG